MTIVIFTISYILHSYANAVWNSLQAVKNLNSSSFDASCTKMKWSEIVKRSKHWFLMTKSLAKMVTIKKYAFSRLVYDE